MRSAVVLLLLGCFGCSSPRGAQPRIAELYDAAAQKEARNPVVVIHGILGARLAQRSTGKTVWGAFTSEGIDPDSAEGARALAPPLEPPASAMAFDPAQEDVYASGPLERLKLSFLYQVISVDVYAGILQTLGAGGYRDQVLTQSIAPHYAADHFTCFSFFYDWRRDNVENAIMLGRFLRAKRVEIDRSARNRIARLRAEAKPSGLAEARELEDWLARGFRFDIVAHSMGGLIARYYLQFGEQDLPADGAVPEVTWAGTSEVDRLIMVGTPNFGSMDALQTLTAGFEPSFVLPRYHPVVVGSMPALYQLLPRARHGVFVDQNGAAVDLDLFDAEVWDRHGWGLLTADGDLFREWLMPDVPAAARRAKAKAYLRWCLARARQLHAALDQRPATPPRSKIYLFAADAQETLTRARLVPRGQRLMPTFAGRELFGPGDATVPRYSAVADERAGRSDATWLDTPIPWTNVTLLADDHIGLTSNPHFSNNVLFLLLETLPPP